MPLITISDLANIGRFGNQMFLYAFGRSYAEAMGCELQTGPWVGQKIFQNVQEPAPTAALPGAPGDWGKGPGEFSRWFGQKDIDLFCFAQHQLFLDYYSLEQVRRWFELKPEWKEAMSKLPSKAAAHMRHGDFLTNPEHRKRYCIVTKNSYERAIRKFNIPRPVENFIGGYCPPNWRQMETDLEFLPDFLRLMNASHLLRGNSSFSWWAATLGHGKVYAPLVGNKTGECEVEFVEGNWPCTAGGFQNQSNLYLKPK